MSLLVDSYKPQTIEELVLIEEQKAFFKRIIADPFNKFVGMTLAGPPGIGKTAIANLIIKLLGADCLKLNASKDNNVENIRGNVSNFCGAQSMENVPKIVLLDEADCLTIGKNGAAGAQETLRGIIEENQDDTRFILTCNYPNRIIPALLSRCPLIQLKFTPKMVMDRVLYILKQEKVKITKKEAKFFFDNVVKTNFPKIRNTIHILDTCITENKTLDFSNISTGFNEELEVFAKELSDKVIAKDKAIDIRKWYITNADQFEDDYIKLANTMFKQMMEYPEKQVLMADYIYKMSVVLDPEIQFYSMILDITE